MLYGLSGDAMRYKMVKYKNIRRLRIENGYTQVQLASYLRRTQACYANYENGKRRVPTKVLSALADFYGVSVDYLLGRTCEKKPYPPKVGL